MGCGMSRGRYDYVINDIPNHQGVAYSQAAPCHQALPLQPMGRRCGYSRRGCHRRRDLSGPNGRRGGCRRRGRWAGQENYGYADEWAVADSPREGHPIDGSRESSLETEFEKTLNYEDLERNKDYVGVNEPPRYSKISAM